MAKTETVASAQTSVYAFSRPLEDHQRHHKFWRRSNHRDREVYRRRKELDGEPLPRDLGTRRSAALPEPGIAEPKHLKKMTSPFPCGILSLRNLLFA